MATIKGEIVSFADKAGVLTLLIRVPREAGFALLDVWNDPDDAAPIPGSIQTCPDNAAPTTNASEPAVKK